MDLSVMFFSGAMASSAGDQYAAVLDVAEFADAHGFDGLWLPERHFSPFGAPFPNPLLLLAAVAARTERLTLRSGSLVATLHDPIRMAEDLAVLDHLSGGRVEAGFASGWMPVDFAFYPERYAGRHALLFDLVDQVQSMWRGGMHDATSGTDEAVRVRTFPRPVRSRLPVWIAAAGNVETFRSAGRRGDGVLTHVLDGNLDGLAANIEAYRAEREAAGLDPDTGRVALMLHTFLGPDRDAVVATVEKPYCDYLRGIAPLARGLATARGRGVDMDRLSARHVDSFVKLQFQRALDGRSLVGTPEDAQRTAASMADLGVTEIACLLDFGLDADHIRGQFPSLGAFRAGLSAPEHVRSSS